MPIEGNQEFVKFITEGIDNGTITDPASFNLYSKNLPREQRTHYRSLANAFKKRFGNRGYDITIGRHQTTDGGTYFEDSLGFGGDAATIGESGRVHQSDDSTLTIAVSTLSQQIGVHVEVVANDNLLQVPRLCLILFLHQTTTPLWFVWLVFCCVLFYFYIKPQHKAKHSIPSLRCVLFYFYILPQ